MTEKWYKDAEREKTLEEKEIIEAVIKKLNVFLSQYGAKPLDIKETHVHVLDKSKMSDSDVEFIEKTFHGTMAFFERRGQEVIVSGWKINGNLEFANAIVHELIHFLSYNSVIVDDAARSGFAPHRLGLLAQSARLENNPIYFRELNEAVTEELTIQFFQYLKEVPVLAEECKIIEEAIEKYSDSDISAVRGEKIYSYAYLKERIRLNNLIKILYEKRKSDFSSEGEVFNVFARAAMTGEVKELATLVETTLGTGTFKKLANSLADFDEI